MKCIKCSPEHINSVLSKSKFFKFLKDEERDRLIKSGELIEFQPGEKLMSEAEVADYFFAIMCGTVNIKIHQKDSEIYLTTLGAGEIIGEAAIFINCKRTADVEAYEKVTVLKINRATFIEFIKSSPSSGIKILMVIIHSLLKKLRLANEELAFERTTHIDQDEIDKFIEDNFN